MPKIVRSCLVLVPSLLAVVAVAFIQYGPIDPDPLRSQPALTYPLPRLGVRASVDISVQGHVRHPEARGAGFGRWRGEVGLEAMQRTGEVLATRTPAGFVADAGAMGFTLLESLPLRHLGLTVHRLRPPQRDSVAKAMLRLRQRFPRAVVDANHLFTKAGAGGLPAMSPRALIGWTQVPEDCGKGVRLGMIDAGVDPDHPALRSADLDYRTFMSGTGQADPAEHGTAVAALLVGQPHTGHHWDGLLPAAHLSAASIFEVGDDDKPVATARALLEAVDWLVGQRVAVVNFSVAGPHNRIVRLAIERAGRQGAILVAAAGNWGSATRRAYPAAYAEVIAVTAVSADGKAYERANRGSYLEFSAPGVGLWTAVPGGGRFQSGTSFATPYLSAMAGLALAEGVKADVDTLRGVLRQDVLDLGIPGRDDVFGWGLARMQPTCNRRPAERVTSLSF